MLKADLGDFLYIIIFVVLMLAGALEKYVKAKKQQADRNPLPPQPRQPYDDFEDEEDVPQPKHAQPQTLEDILKRMMQPDESQEVIEEPQRYPEEAQSLETIPAEPAKRSDYQPLTNSMTSRLVQSAKKHDYKPLTSNIFSQLEGENLLADIPPEEEWPVHIGEYDFDLRKAVIASEILNRKY